MSFLFDPPLLVAFRVLIERGLADGSGPSMRAIDHAAWIAEGPF